LIENHSLASPQIDIKIRIPSPLGEGARRADEVERRPGGEVKDAMKTGSTSPARMTIEINCGQAGSDTIPNAFVECFRDCHGKTNIHYIKNKI